MTRVFPVRCTKNQLMNPLSRLCGLPPPQRLALLLWVVAAHSIMVGMILVIQPAILIRLMGFGEIHERFFPCQGGVFHMVMAIAYIYGAMDIHKNKNMIIYAIIVKMAATLFLFFYYFFIERHWIIFLSAMIDFSMGVAIWGLLWVASAGYKAHEKAAP